MVTLEQVKLLESKVATALEFVGQVTGEHTLLKEKLDIYQKRISELEILIQTFREEQGRIEEGILNALDRLNQFEAAVENSLSPIKAGAPKHSAGEEAPEAAVPPEEPPPYKTESAETGTASGGSEERYAPAEDEGEEADEDILFGSGGNGEAGTGEDTEPAHADEPVVPSELDIF